MQASRGAGATLVSKNVAWATLDSNVIPKILVGLVNEISILGWFDKIFCNLIFDLFSAAKLGFNEFSIENNKFLL